MGHENISGGRIQAASIVLNAGLDELVSRKKGDPMREEALTLKMQFSDISIRPLRQLPPIANARANFVMRGTSFQAICLMSQPSQQCASRPDS